MRSFPPMETMRPMNNLGNIYASMGRFDEAIPLWDRALELKVRYLGADHPSTLNTLNNLAEIEEIFGHYDRAESLHQEVVDARVRVLGPEHPMTLLSMAQLAFVRGRLGHLEQALLDPRYAAFVEQLLGISAVRVDHH